MSFFLKSLKTIIAAFLPFFILINLYVFVIANYGDSYNFLHVNLENFDANSYFGFTSFVNMIKDFPVDAWNELIQRLMELMDIFLFRIPSLITIIQNFNGSTTDIVELVRNIADILFQPIVFLLQLLHTLVYFIALCMDILMIIYDALGGKYNIPYRDSPYPLEPPSSYIFYM